MRDDPISIGLDTVTADQLRHALSVAPIASVQNRHSLVHRDHADVLKLCERAIAFLRYLPLAGGPLADASARDDMIAAIAEIHDATPS